MTRKVIAWIFFAISLGVVAFVAFGCGADANAPDSPPITRAPTPTETEPTETPVSSPAVTDDPLTRLSVDDAWNTYTPQRKTDMCSALVLLGPDEAVEIFKSQKNASRLDPDVAVDELTQLCNE